jgi:pimeloyl-ACP methyl ester carboxylesterase/DNA-binding CsgD family transcriptional regulator
MGLSDRRSEPEHYTLEAQVADLSAVLDAAGASRVALFSWSTGGVIALAFAATQPLRVSRLVLLGSYARLMWAPNFSIGLVPDQTRALADLLCTEWHHWARTLANIYIPSDDVAHNTWYAQYLRAAITPKAAGHFLLVASEYDLRGVLPLVQAPVLVLHRRHDRSVPFRMGVYLAEHLPHASFQELEGQHPLPYFGDSQSVVDAIIGFLPAPDRPPGSQPLSPRETEVLSLLTEGCPNREIANRLYISRATVSRHLASIYLKLGVSTRAAATAYALRHGLV